MTIQVFNLDTSQTLNGALSIPAGLWGTERNALRIPPGSRGRTSLRPPIGLLAYGRNFGMGNTTTTTELAGLRVTIDKLVYRRLPVGSAERPHSFVYFVSIHNDTDVAVTIKGRKWVVTHSDGQVLVVEGDGVVGQQPTIPPSGKFSYNSQHLISTAHATAEGAYLGLDENGRRIVARIPKFQMVVPG